MEQWNDGIIDGQIQEMENWNDGNSGILGKPSPCSIPSFFKSSRNAMFRNSIIPTSCSVGPKYNIQNVITVIDKIFSVPELRGF
jgi:hypothetical protein